MWVLFSLTINWLVNGVEGIILAFTCWWHSRFNYKHTSRAAWCILTNTLQPPCDHTRNYTPHSMAHISMACKLMKVIWEAEEAPMRLVRCFFLRTPRGFSWRMPAGIITSVLAEGARKVQAKVSVCVCVCVCACVSVCESVCMCAVCLSNRVTPQQAV